MTNQPPDRGRESVRRARDIVLRYGWNATSFQIVNPGIRRWFAKSGDGVVGFVTASGVRVVAGAPVCPEERVVEVASEFEEQAASRGERVCYFCAESRLLTALSLSDDYSKFLIGAQPSWHPASWADLIKANRSLRAQVNRAKNKGVVITEWPVAKAADNPELAQCLESWLRSKGLPAMHFMIESDTLSRLEDRRVFVAEHEGAVVGFLVLSPIRSRNGWLFEQFPHRPGAPNGTVEAMIDAAMRTLAKEGAEYATLGTSPLSQRAGVASTDDPFWLRFVLGWLRRHGRRFYNFDGLDSFKAKLKPERWEPVFAVYNRPRLSLRVLYAIAGAFSGNSPFRLITGGLARAASTEARWLKRKIFAKPGARR